MPAGAALIPWVAAYAAQAWVRVIALVAVVGALLLAGAVLGTQLTRAHWYAERATWAQERAALANQHAAAQVAAREQERRRAADAQQVIDKLGQAQATAATRAARAERAAAGLRDEIARLNARPVPDAPGCPAVAGYAGEARTARELLGACAEEHQRVAAEADRLRDQVTGLQGWVDAIQK